jgi:hypothetical protein
MGRLRRLGSMSREGRSHPEQGGDGSRDGKSVDTHNVNIGR